MKHSILLAACLSAALLLMVGSGELDATEQPFTVSDVAANGQIDFLPGVWEGFGGVSRGCSNPKDAVTDGSGLVYLLVDSKSCGELRGGPSFHENIFVYDPGLNEVIYRLPVRVINRLIVVKT